MAKNDEKINPLQRLSRRERQIMDVIYRRGSATVAEVIEEMEDPPSYSAVRTLLGILERKGCLTHEKSANRFVYLPIQPRENAARQALQRVLQTFFGGSVSDAMATLIDISDADLPPEEAERLSKLIEQAKEEGR